MPYQTIIFDLDGTLRESNPHFMDALHDCLLQKSIQVDSFQWRLTERWVHAYWAQSPELIEDATRYGQEGVWNRFIYRLMEHVGHPLAPEEAAPFAQCVRDSYQTVSELTPGAQETLEALQAAGVMLGLLSNRTHSYDDELDALGIASYFDFTLAAGEVGVWKPRPGIFLEALKRAGGVPPEAALYIGDNYYADIVGARNVGIEAVLVDPRRVFTDKRCLRVERLDEVLVLLAEMERGTG